MTQIYILNPCVMLRPFQILTHLICLALGVPLKLGQPPSSYVITGGVPNPPWLWVGDPLHPSSFL